MNTPKYPDLIARSSYTVHTYTHIAPSHTHTLPTDNHTNIQYKHC